MEGLVPLKALESLGFQSLGSGHPIKFGTYHGGYAAPRGSVSQDSNRNGDGRPVASCYNGDGCPIPRQWSRGIIAASVIMNHQRIEQEMHLRSKFMRRMQDARSVDQRLDQFAKLQQVSFDLLLASPEGYQNFLRRNLHSRRVEVVDGEYQPISPARRAQQP